MKLYYSSGACSMAPHLVAHELGIKVQTVKVDLATKKYEGGDFYKVNPKGSVPTLQLDNGEVLTEGAVISQYLADQKPEANLVPKAGTFERYRVQEWLNFIATELHKTMGPLWSDQTPEPMKVRIKELLGRKLTFVSEKLKGNDYLMGKWFTVADPYLFTILSWCKPLKVDLTPFPPVLGFMERMAARPATQATLKAEGLLK